MKHSTHQLMQLHSILCAILGLIACFATSVSAQVPQLINYQGRVAVGTVNFEGTGQFRFALVNATGTTTYWSNDGTSVAGSEPTAAVSLTVTKGLYSVLLGDTTLPNMQAVPATVFANSDVRLRVWFNDGTNGSQLLTPDQRIASVGYALMADTALTVPNASITSAKLASGAAVANLNSSGQTGVASGGVILSTSINASLTTAGYSLLGTTTTADVWQQRGSLNAPEAREGHTAVWANNDRAMIVWGGRGIGGIADLPSIGGVYDMDADTWSPTAPFNGLIKHTAVWSGATSSMVINGEGGNAQYTLSKGGKWTALPSDLRRSNHTAVMGSNGNILNTEMLVWGGRNDSTGGRYNFNFETWSAMSTTNAPSPREDHTAVWTGSKMIVWGGVEYDSYSNIGGPIELNTGGIYDPRTDTWTSLPILNAPSARTYHTAVWTGTEMLIWGGQSATDTNIYLPIDGARYDPVSNRWSPMDTIGAPVARIDHTAVWTGTEMIVWGGRRGYSEILNTGARYDPATNTWINLPADLAPSGRYNHSAVWTGTEMLVFGGSANTGYSNGLFSYKPGRTLYLYQRP